MTPGTRSNEHASLKLSIPFSLPDTMRDKVLEVTSLSTDPEFRMRGHATDLMDKVCWEADKAKIALMLEPRDYDEGGPSARALQAWYFRRFGFVVFQNASKKPKLPTLMIRTPR